jgi:hypothetical protein
MRQVPKPSELLDQARRHKENGFRTLRFEVPPRQRLLERFPRIWDGVSVRTVGRRMESVTLVSGEVIMVTEALICEAHVTTIIEAARREAYREAFDAAQPLDVNQVKQRRVIVGPR